MEERGSTASLAPFSLHHLSSLSVYLCLYLPPSTLSFFPFSLQLSPSLDSSRQETRNNRRQESELHSDWVRGGQKPSPVAFFSPFYNPLI